MRGRGDRTHIEELENQLAITRVMARRLWDTLRQRNAEAAWAAYVGAKLNREDEELRVMDVVFEAAERIFDSKRIAILPCRTILDPGGAPTEFSGLAWPAQSEMYLGRWPDGTERNLTRDQVMMMAGMDPPEPHE